MYLKAKKITGYHGTYLENEDSILQNNFNESTNHLKWLGDGVYFFVEGISDNLIQDSYQFAKDQCFDKKTQKYNRENIIVLEASIKLNEDKLLDLTSLDGLKYFNHARKEVEKTLINFGKLAKNKIIDYQVIVIMIQNLGFEFVKSNFYFKFADQRRYRIESEIPNVTVMLVKNPSENIQKPTIRRVLLESVE